MSDAVFTQWNEADTALFGRHPLRLSHELHTSPLFCDDTLAGLIEACPRSNYSLVTMGGPDEPRHLWREGEVGACSGADALDAIKRGRMWINLQRVEEFDPRYADLLDAMFDELEAHVPGLSTFRRKLGILISSPRAQVYYHADVPGQSLWQIRGSKRVWVYPNSAPFLPQEELEGIVLGRTEEEIGYQTWFDDHAVIYDLEPGQMLHWPLNGPHRVVNHDCLNVSITTEHWTGDIRANYAVHYANGLLRRSLGMRSLSARTSGPAFLAKAGLAAAHKFSGIGRRGAAKRMVDFRLDHGTPGFMSDIPAYAR